MDAATFDRIVEQRLASIRQVLKSKSVEYTNGNKDRLVNFKHGAALTGLSPTRTCWGYLAKHLSSIKTMIESGERQDPAKVDEKIGDAVNYLILLEGLMLE